MNQDDVVAVAFDILLEEVEKDIEELIQKVARASQKRDYSSVRDLTAKVSQIAAVRDTIKDIQKEWDNLFSGVVTQDKEHLTKERLQSQMKERLKSGLRITIRLTESDIKYDYIHLHEHKDFFPPDSVGASSKKKGEGKPLRLHVKGIAETIDTDIAGGKMIFRKRGWCSRFFDFYRLRAGDEVVIEKVSDYEYKVYPKSEQ